MLPDKLGQVIGEAPSLGTDTVPLGVVEMELEPTQNFPQSNELAELMGHLGVVVVGPE